MPYVRRVYSSFVKLNPTVNWLIARRFFSHNNFASSSYCKLWLYTALLDGVQYYARVLGYVPRRNLLFCYEKCVTLSRLWVRVTTYCCVVSEPLKKPGWSTPFFASFTILLSRHTISVLVLEKRDDLSMVRSLVAQ